MWLGTYATGYSATASSEFAQTIVPKVKQGARAVVYAHGAVQTAANIYQNQSVQPWIFGRAGLVFIAADLGGGTTWGNSTARDRITDAWNYAIALGAKADKVLLYGGSMGSLNVLRWGLENPTKVAACAVNLPIVNLADVHDNNRGGYATTIETAQGVTGTYAGNSTITARDPIQNEAAFTFPMRMWYSTDDTVGRPADALAFAAAVGAGTVSMGAQGHTLNNFTPQDAVDYLKAFA